MQLRPADIGELLEIMNTHRLKIMSEHPIKGPEPLVLLINIVHSMLLQFQSEVLDELRATAFPQSYKRL